MYSGKIAVPPGGGGIVKVSNNLLQNSVEPQSLQTLSNHNDSFCPIIDSPNTIQTDIHNLDLSYNDIEVFSYLVAETKD
jgi:hypothetical protein